MSNNVTYNAFRARHVMGSFTNLVTLDRFNNNAPLGDAKEHWFAGFAVPKGAAWDALWSTMYGAAKNDPLCGAKADSKKFNFKIEDCDNPDKPENKGTDAYPAGHWIIKLKRNKKMGPVKVYDTNRQEMGFDQINKLKKGDYFYVAASCKYNQQDNNPGMYQNIDGLMFCESGEEIESSATFNADVAFAEVPMTPTAPTVPSTPTVPAAPGTPPPPEYGILTPPKYSINPEFAAKGVTEAVIDAWIAEGKTDIEKLKASKYLL